MPRPAAPIALLLLGLVAPAVGEVRITVRPDGRKVIYNESETQRSWRLSGRLLPVPGSDLAAWIEAHALDRGLEPMLVQAVIQVESGYNVRALSSKGAMGLMQLMPGTASELAVDDPWDPEQNIRGGTEYLGRMLERLGSLELALAAYNAGPEAVERHGGIPPYEETRDYVQRVLRLYDGRWVTGEAERDGRPVLIQRDGANRIRLVTAGSGSGGR